MNESDCESKVKKPKLLDPQETPVPNYEDKNQNVEIHQNVSNCKEQEGLLEPMAMMVDYSQDDDDEDIKANVELLLDKGFEILSPDQIFESMIEIVDGVKEIISDLPTACLMTLLNHVKWNKERLVEHYFDFDDPDKFLKDAKVMVPVPADIDMPTVDPKPPTSPSEDLIDCAICYESVQHGQSSAMPCGHRFCKSCWKSYLESEVMDKGESQMITCPEVGCPIFVGHEMIKLLVQDEPTILRKYQQLISSHFVDANPRLRWCPSAGCENAVVVEVGWTRAGITCSCGHNFCFLCSEDWHEPIKCDYLVRWLKKCRSDQASCTWMLTNTKDCPKCKTMIEKNGGCNRMTCRSKSCRYDFCWVCLKGWSEHRGNAYACNKYVDGNTAGEKGGEQRNSLKRYIHYYERFLTHQQSLQFESQLKDTVRDKMIVFQQEWQMSWVDVQFFEIAAKTLCRCRKTLQYTYAFAYFMENTNQLEIFENNQRDLESATEILSGYLENDLLPDGDKEKANVGILAIKLKIVNSSAYCEARRVVLISHVQDRYDEDFWTYRTVANS